MCDPISAIAGGSALLGVVEGNKNRKAAKSAQKSANSQADKQLELATKEFEYNKKVTERSFDLQQQDNAYRRAFAEEARGYVRGEAAADYQARIATANELVDSAKTSPEALQSEVALARSEAGKGFDAARDNLAIELGRYGVNPNSGKFAGAARALELGRSGAQIDAANATRRDIRLADRSALSTALQAKLGVQRVIPGESPAPISNITNPTVSNPAIGVLGGLSDRNAAYAADYSAAGSNALAAGLNTAGLLVGYNYNNNRVPAGYVPDTSGL